MGIFLRCRKGKSFREGPFALHRLQPEKDKRYADVTPPGKNSADADDQKHCFENFFKNLLRYVLPTLGKNTLGVILVYVKWPF